MTRHDSTGSIDLFAPWRTLQETNINIWARLMEEAIRPNMVTQAVTNTLDTYISATAPFQLAIDQYMNMVFPSASQQSRDVVAELAARLGGLERALVAADQRTGERLERIPAEIEDLRTHVHALPPQISTLDQQLHTLAGRMDGLEQHGEVLRVQLADAGEQSQAVVGHVDTLEQRFHVLSEQLAEVDRRVQAVPDRFAVLEQRLDDLAAMLDRHVQRITDEVAQVAARPNDGEAAAEALEVRLQSMAEDIAALRQVVHPLKAEQTAAPSGRRRRGNGTA